MLGLPSLHTLDHAQGARIWFAAEATDMRCGFDRLAERVRAVIGQDPLSGHLFLCERFANHRLVTGGRTAEGLRFEPGDGSSIGRAANRITRSFSSGADSSTAA